MKKYDVIVIGSGCGLNIVNETLVHGLSVALVDKGPLGGTCANLGCIPSKMLIFPAERITEIQEAKKLGIDIDIRNTDFKSIMERTRKVVREDREHLRHELSYVDNLDFCEGEGHFVNDYPLRLTGKK